MRLGALCCLTLICAFGEIYGQTVPDVKTENGIVTESTDKSNGQVALDELLRFAIERKFEEAGLKILSAG